MIRVLNQFTSVLEDWTPALSGVCLRLVSNPDYHVSTLLLWNLLPESNITLPPLPHCLLSEQGRQLGMSAKQGKDKD